MTKTGFHLNDIQ